MNWQDEGYIVSKKKFRENAIILDVFTKDFGKVSGIVYGGTSRKIKNYLQLSNKIYVFFNSKSENRLGYFKTELIEAIAPKYFDDSKKTICLNSVSSIIKILLPENEVQKKIYQSLDIFLKNLPQKNWPLHYLYWEINLIHDLGYGFNVANVQTENAALNKVLTVKVDNVEYKIPGFIILKNYESVNSRDIYDGLSFSRNLMENKFFIPNNLKFPYSRKLLEKKIL